MQAVQQPDEVAVPAYHRAASARGLDLVVAVLEHEHAFFLGKQRDSDDVFRARAGHHTSANGPRRRMEAFPAARLAAEPSQYRRPLGRTKRGGWVAQRTPSRPGSYRRHVARLPVCRSPKGIRYRCGRIAPTTRGRADAAKPVGRLLGAAGDGMIMALMELGTGPWILIRAKGSSSEIRCCRRSLLGLTRWRSRGARLLRRRLSSMRGESIQIWDPRLR